MNDHSVEPSGHRTGRHVEAAPDAHSTTGTGSGGRSAGGADDPQARRELNRLAISATLHCLTGCAIGEVLGMVVGTALGWADLPTIALAVALAFVFGYSFTIVPVLRSGLALRAALGVALAADTISITVMEIVDNAIMLLVPGAMDASLDSVLFWGALAVALAVAFVVTVPVNRALIRRGKGHAVVHQYHHKRGMRGDLGRLGAGTRLAVLAHTADGVCCGRGDGSPPNPSSPAMSVRTEAATRAVR